MKQAQVQTLVLDCKNCVLTMDKLSNCRSYYSQVISNILHDPEFSPAHARLVVITYKILHEEDNSQEHLDFLSDFFVDRETDSEPSEFVKKLSIRNISKNWYSDNIYNLIEEWAFAGYSNMVGYLPTDR